MPTDSTCVFFKTGLNDIYQISTPESVYFLRISLRYVYHTEQIDEEIRLIEHLRIHGLSVVEPIPCKDGSYVAELSAPEGMRQAVLFRGIENSPQGDADARMKNLGILLARMHTASRTFQQHSVRPYINDIMLVDEPTTLLHPFLKHRPDDLDFLDKTAKTLWSSVDSLLSKSGDVTGFCHGDVQPNNFFFHGEQPVLFDFDCMGQGYFVYDLGVLLANLSFLDNQIDQKSLWISVLDGYQSIRSMNENEKKAIYCFAALHMLRVLAYHAKCRERNQGAFYFMTDHHLDTFFGAYRRLALQANENADLHMI
ncbi:MAG: hypothetical protein E7604_08575 [Ruminococcaceae bacterium]|nr:hypothetical protein [Oscillospiraceae bacterium]